MKKIKKSNIPPKLDTYFTTNPTKVWNDFKKGKKKRYTDVILQLKKDQGGICCYCENNFHNQLDNEGDFRVEHFHPKSDTSNPAINWNLIWTNLLGCCSGGNQNIENPNFLKERYITHHTDRHCDVLKDDNDWDNIILNPLEIPAFPPIFKVHSDGKMIVLEDNCKKASIDILKAKNCLDNTKLNLNSSNLKNWRKVIITVLRDKMDIAVNSGNIEFIMEQTEELLSTYLVKDDDDNFHEFFTAIRSYFEEDAEEFLRLHGYDG